MRVPTALRAARRRAGFTQAELARRAATSQAAISAYESGHKHPSVRTLSRLLAATGFRLVAEPGHKPVFEPSAARHARTGRTLVDVIALAEALPTRHAAELSFPGLGSVPGRRAA